VKIIVLSGFIQFLEVLEKMYCPWKLHKCPGILKILLGFQ
jgi:hypothetical protein